MSRKSLRGVGGKLREKFRQGRQQLQHFDAKRLEDYVPWVRWGILVLGVFLASQVVTRLIGLWLRPTYPQMAKKTSAASPTNVPTEDYDAILRRNIFDVTGKIPDPFDQGMLDCMSQARPSSQKLQLLGTIVMSDEDYSVALIQEDGNAAGKLAVKKNDLFLSGRYIALKVERKRLCFQVTASQDFEYIEIPEQDLGMPGATFRPVSTGGISQVDDTHYVVDDTYLKAKIDDLNNVLMTAKAVPYIDGGQFKGFIVQSIEPDSPFAQLGIQRSDVLTGVNDIVLDSQGKGLEAYQMLREAPSVSLQILRNGQKMTLNYDRNK